MRKGRLAVLDDLLDARVWDFNPRYARAEGALLVRFRYFHSDTNGNREFVEHLCNLGIFFACYMSALRRVKHFYDRDCELATNKAFICR
jgi:hypothetical protein